MVEFKSWKSYRNFAHDVKRHTRYMLGEESREFLAAVLATSGSRARTEVPGRLLWRAQVGCDWREDSNGCEQPEAYPPERMKPIKDKASEGRANPRGIPHLYVAIDAETAIAEVRPWLGADVSVAQFRSVRELRLVNCAQDASNFFRHVLRTDEPPPEEREREVWGQINEAFSFPVGPTDDYANYIPTQILAELFKVNGFDGVLYRSSLGPGANCCLFDVDVAELLTCQPYTVNGVKIDATPSGNPYYVRRATSPGNTDDADCTAPPAE